MLLEFKSLSQPFLVLLSLPFGLIGVVFAFIFHSEPFGFFAIIGWIGLSGVIVNDAIVMIDLMNELRNQPEYQDNQLNLIIKGASQRLRPILLTTVTTVVGLVPSIYGWGGSVYILRPVTMALAYGLLFGMFLTLILIPCFYAIDQDIRKKILILKKNIFFLKKE